MAAKEELAKRNKNEALKGWIFKIKVWKTFEVGTVLLSKMLIQVELKPQMSAMSMIKL